MSFRKLILIVITLLLAGVLFVQWWSINTFSQDISQKIGESAFEVSRSTAQQLIVEQPRVQFRSFSFNSQLSQVDREKLSHLMTEIHQNVVIELIDKQEDDFILLNADGSEFQIPIPRTGIDESLDKFSNKVLYATLTLLVIGIVLASAVTYKLTLPLKKLQNASKKIGAGELGVQIKKGSDWQTTEIDSTLDSFNLMSKRILELSEQNQELQNKAHLVELAEIAKGLAHTLRNPLNTLGLAVDELESNRDASKQKELTQIARHQIRRIDQWVDSLMRLMNSDESLIAEFDLHETLGSLVEDFQMQANHEFKIKFEPDDTAAIVCGVESEIRAVLQSLIANAVEASPEGTCIEIFCRQLDDKISVSIHDQGPGFHPKILERLFMPHNTDKTYGAGMGLYLAERIVANKYQGEIKVTNQNPNGAIVNVCLKTGVNGLG